MGLNYKTMNVKEKLICAPIKTGLKQSAEGNGLLFADLIRHIDTIKGLFEATTISHYEVHASVYRQKR